MKTTLYMIKLYDSFKPLDKASVEAMEQISANEKMLVEIRGLSKRDIRSTFQNKLYWGWLSDAENTSVNEHSGKTKEEWHYELKKRFLVPIYERDDTGYAATLVALRNVYKNGMKAECEALLKHVVNETSTTNAKIKQFTEYLNDIERYFHALGISLRTDPEIYRAAMGIKN